MMKIFNNKNTNTSTNHQLYNKLINMFISFPLLPATFLILSLIFPSTLAQQPSPPENQQFYNARFSPPMAIIIVILITALFFMGFFSIYIRHCNENTIPRQTFMQTISVRRRGAVAARGIEDDVIKTFPTFSYAEVKDQRIGKGSLECAVCLNEFEDGETLRLIPICDHVFHPECIDTWLQSHVTCPVCRANLAPGQIEAAQPVVEAGEAEVTIREEPRNENGVIRVDFEEEQRDNRPERVDRDLTRGGSLNRAVGRSWSIKKPKMFGFGKFRSHSTGHSLMMAGDNLDRFTLRLPEGVRKEIFNRALLDRNKSYVRKFQGQGSAREGTTAGGGRILDIPGRASKSDRWGFLTRGLSMKSLKVADNGPGSSSKSPRTVVKMPSFECLEPKGSDESETSLVRSDSMRSPV